MKVAIPSRGETLESRLDRRLTHADCFIIIDTKNNEYEIVRNERRELNNCRKTGIETALKLSRHGVAAVITENCGPKTFWELGAVGIRIFYSKEDTVMEVLEKFKSGMLKEAVKANVECEWGSKLSESN